MLKKPKKKARVLRGGNQLRADPTRTTTLRKMFMRAFSVRMDRLKSAIWQLVAEEDAFGLAKTSPLTFNYNPTQPRDNRGRWSSVTAHGSVSPQQKSAVEAYVSSLPLELQKIPIHLVQKVSQDPHFSNTTEKPRGYAPGSTWDNTPGAFIPSENRVVVATTRKSIVDYRTSNIDPLATLPHELGHAFDKMGGKKKHSENATFRKAYDKDVANLVDKQAVAYYLQSGKAAYEEAFAEAFGVVTAKGRVRILPGSTHDTNIRRFQKSFPNTLLHVSKELKKHMVVNFNPSQPRDNRGRWSNGGSGGKHDHIVGEFDPSVTKSLGFDKEMKFLDSLTEEEAKSLNEYKGEDPYAGGAAIGLNGMLRAGAKLREEQQKALEKIDEAFRKAPRFAKKTTLYRGTSELVPTDKYGSLDTKGFTSTSTRRSVAEDFSTLMGDEGYVYKISVPKGFVGLPTSHFHSGSTIADESEVLLPRGASIRVTGRKGRTIQAEVVGGEAWMRMAQEGFTTNAKAITMLMLEDQTLRNRMSDIQALLDPEDVIELETDPHVTVRYGLRDLTFQQVRTLLRNYPQVWLKLGRLSLFQNADADVLKLEVHSEELHKINRRLRNLDEGDQTHKTYSPHITVAFLKPGTGYKYIHSLSNPFYGVDVLFKTLTYSSSGKEVTEVLLNTRWKFNTTTDQVRQFQQWLQQRFTQDIVDEAMQDVENAYWYQFIAEAYQKGAGKSFDDVNRQHLRGDKKQLDFYKGTRKEFLRQSFAQPVQIERVKTLAGRVLTELTGVTQAMSVSMSRILVDGLAQGKGPREVARELNNTVDKIGRNRALTIARTETIRAHAEGQLDSLTNLGIEAVGVAVEWDTTGDGRVCPLCRPLDGIVLKVEEARGMLPRHPNCRCSWIPANVGEAGEKQKKRASDIKQARDASILAEIPKDSKRTILEQKKRTSWGGADTKFTPKRPKSILD